MLFNYPVSAVKHNNWVHESIYEAIVLIINKINKNLDIPEWPDTLPKKYRNKLSSRETLPKLLAEFTKIATPLSTKQRNKIIDFIKNENDINGLLDNTIALMPIDADIQLFIPCLKKIFIEGYALLTKTLSRDAHYRAIYNAIPAKTCPFCGYMPFEGPSSKIREDLDHYLLKDKYISSATNFYNLAPMCGKCNSRCKGIDNIIFDGKIRRKALNPYGNIAANISLLDTEPSTLLKEEPEWKISFTPDIEEIKTWDKVFSVKKRLISTVLKPNLDSVLNEAGDYFEDIGVIEGCSHNQLISAIKRFEKRKSQNPDLGITYLKGKVIEMLRTHVENNDFIATSLIRNCLRTP